MIEHSQRKDTFGRVYAGILITNSAISWIIGRKVQTPSGASPFAFLPHADPRFCGRLNILSPADLHAKLPMIINHLMTLGEDLEAIGIASYGPLKSVGIKQRNLRYVKVSGAEPPAVPDLIDHQVERTYRDWPYGVVSENTPHDNLREIDLYESVRRALSQNAQFGDHIGVAIQTDVTCGALCEAFHDRHRERKAKNRSQSVEEDMVVFLHLDDGVGGGFVINRKTAGSANHPEIGYVPLADGSMDDTDDQVSKRPAPVFVEERVSIQTILSKARQNRHLPEDADFSWDALEFRDWEFAIDCIAHLCATITFILGPHQIILHGAIAELTHYGKPFPERVRERVGDWMTVSRAGKAPYLTYAERECGDFIAGANYVTWDLDEAHRGHVDPMLYGALIYGAQVEPENPRKTNA